MSGESQQKQARVLRQVDRDEVMVDSQHALTAIYELLHDTYQRVQGLEMPPLDAAKVAGQIAALLPYNILLGAQRMHHLDPRYDAPGAIERLGSAIARYAGQVRGVVERREEFDNDFFFTKGNEQ